jgi:hypothetical protein
VRAGLYYSTIIALASAVQCSAAQGRIIAPGTAARDGAPSGGRSWKRPARGAMEGDDQGCRNIIAAIAALIDNLPLVRQTVIKTQAFCENV